MFRRFFCTLLMLLPLCHAPTLWSVTRLMLSDRDAYGTYWDMSPDTLLQQAQRHYHAARLDSAIFLLQFLNQRYVADGEPRKYASADIAALTMLGKIHLYTLYNYSSAYSFLQRGLDLSAEYGDTMHINELTTAQASLHSAVATITGSGEYARQALQLMLSGVDRALDAGNTGEALTNLNNALTLLLHEGRELDADIALRLARLEELDSSGLPLHNFTPHYGRLYLAIKRGDIAAADSLATLLEADWARDLSHNRVIRLVAMAAHVAVEEARGITPTLLHSLERARIYAEEQGINDALCPIYIRYVDYYTHVGDSDSANAWRVRWYEQRDKLLGVTADIGWLDAIRHKYDIDRTTGEMTRLNARRRADAVMLWSALVIIVLASVFLWYYRASWQRERRARKELYLRNIELLARETATVSVGMSVPEDQDTQALAQRAKEWFAKGYDAMLQDGFTLSAMAETLGVSVRQLSHALNTCLGGTFATLLSRARINEACRRINRGDYANYTIEAIGQSVGFRSRTTFIAAFRRVTGLIPSEYLAEARHRHSIKT